MTYRELRIAAIRRWADDHRTCCGGSLSHQIVTRALAAYDRLPVPPGFAADVATIMGMSPRDADYNTKAARAARYLYRAIAEREVTP